MICSYAQIWSPELLAFFLPTAEKTISSLLGQKTGTNIQWESRDASLSDECTVHTNLQWTTMGPALVRVLDLTLLINPSKPVAW